MSNKIELLYGYTSHCNGCRQYCKRGITKQYNTIYRPVINETIIYDYTIHKRWSSEFHDTISFNATDAHEKLLTLTQYCANECKSHPLGKIR